MPSMYPVRVRTRCGFTKQTGWLVKLLALILLGSTSIAGEAPGEICESFPDESLVRPFFDQTSNSYGFTAPRDGTFIADYNLTLNTTGSSSGTGLLIRIVRDRPGSAFEHLANHWATGELGLGSLQASVSAGDALIVFFIIDGSASGGEASYSLDLSMAGEEGCRSPVTIVADDFEVSSSQETGWAPGSQWTGSISFDTAGPINPDTPRYARSEGFPNAFRDLSSQAVSEIDSAEVVWLGFQSRFDRAKDPSQFAGVSFYVDGTEVFYTGGGFFGTQWSTVFNATGEIDVGHETSAEWTNVLVRFDFLANETIVFLNGDPVQFRSELPPRGWNRMRIGNGFGIDNRIYVDNLKVGETREAVESPLGPLLYSAKFSSFEERNYGRERSRTTLLYGTLGSYPTSELLTLGIATDGDRVFTGHQNPGIVLAHDSIGSELFSWSAPATLQSMTFRGADLAIGSDDGITFHDPDTGVVQATLPVPCASGNAPTGLAYDGASIWAMCDDLLVSINPGNGAFERSIPNPAFGSGGCPFGLQRAGLAATAPGELTVGCNSDGTVTTASGWRLRSVDGSVIDTTSESLGNGLAAIPVPEPMLPTAMIAGLLGIRALGTRRKH